MIKAVFIEVPKRGLEPPRGCPHYILKAVLACVSSCICVQIARKNNPLVTPHIHM